MLFLIIVIVLFVASILLAYMLEKNYTNYGLHLISVFATVALGILLIFIPILRLDSKLLVQEIKAFELTVDENRNTKSEVERAAILTQISKYNSRLARAKYMNSTFMGDIFIVDELCELDYLE